MNSVITLSEMLNMEADIDNRGVNLPSSGVKPFVFICVQILVPKKLGRCVNCGYNKQLLSSDRLLLYLTGYILKNSRLNLLR